MSRSAAESLGESGAVLGVVVLLLLQQLGFLALPNLLTAVVGLVVAVAIGGLLFALVGQSVDRRRGVR